MNRILPIVLIGSLAYALNNISIPQYQHFIITFAGGFISEVLAAITKCTLNCYSFYLAGSTAISLSEEQGIPPSKHYMIVATSIVTFFLATGFHLSHYFNLEAFSQVNSITAIISALCATYIYRFYDTKIEILKDKFEFPLNYSYNAPFFTIVPFGVTLLTESIILTFFFRFSELVEKADPLLTLFNTLFKNNRITLIGLETYTFIKNIFFFFGINGSNILNRVSLFYLYPAVKEYTPFKNAIPVEGDIYTPYYLIFQAQGGAGLTLALLISILLFSKRRSSKTIAKTASLPALFNINEIIIYGMPIMFNPVLIIPFIIVPMVCVAITYFAIQINLLPVPQMAISWTTPALISGYLMSHTITGTIIQLMCILIGILIYRPFIKIHDELLLDSEKEEIQTLTKLYKQSEYTTKEVFLTRLRGTSGIVARIIAHDFDNAIKNNAITIMYQPQFDNNLKIFGVEALLRWKHPAFGSLYPPLIIKLATETGHLLELEETIFMIVAKDMTKNPSLKYSINATPISLREPKFIQFLISTFSDFLENNFKIYIEITEQSELITDNTMLSHLRQLKEAGFKLAIDDFSMGHTSLSYIQQNHFDLIKLDGSMTKQVLTNIKTQEIIDSLVYLSKNSGFSILAEYVETKDQVDILQQMGCMMYQGSLCGMAVPFQFIDINE
ncbi:MAG: EAL domain-containing protein [Treponema sp.]|nr:EAL domain-containing protein [Treponema sp.]